LVEFLKKTKKEKNEKMKTCKTCNKRDLCQELCPDMEEQVKLEYNPMQTELVDHGTYDYLLEYKIESPLVLDELGYAEKFYSPNDVATVAKLFWSDGLSPSKISEFVRFSVMEVAEIISEMHFILEKTIVSKTRSKITRVAIRMYFYERKSINEIADDLDETYLNLYKSIRRIIERIKKNDPNICKHITNIERFTIK
jgi:predicted transcriptional regulator